MSLAVLFYLYRLFTQFFALYVSDLRFFNRRKKYGESVVW